MNAVEELLAPVIGQYVWGVHWDSQLSLRMSFGSPHLTVLEPLPSRPTKRLVVPKGQWWLWVYFAYWRISLDGNPVAKGGTLQSRSPFERILEATTGLDGQKVTAVRVKPKSGSLVLAFDLGGRLDVRPISRKKKQEVWLMYFGNGEPVLSVRSDGKFSQDKKVDDEDWFSIS